MRHRNACPASGSAAARRSGTCAATRSSKTRRAEVPTREPGDHLDVAQAARAALDVRLEVVGRVVVAVVPRGLLVELRAKELRAVPHAIRGRSASGSSANSRAGTVQQPRLHQRRQHRDVAARLRFAIVERADAVPDFEADVPEERQEPADRLVASRSIALSSSTSRSMSDCGCSSPRP